MSTTDREGNPSHAAAPARHGAPTDSSGLSQNHGLPNMTPAASSEPATLTARLPLLPLFENVVFPGTVHPLTLQGEHVSSLLAAAHSAGGVAALFFQRDAKLPAVVSNLAPVGTLVRLAGLESPATGPVELSAEGLKRVRLDSLAQSEPHAEAFVTLLDDSPTPQTPTLERAALQARTLYVQLLKGDPTAAERIAPLLDETASPTDLAYLIAATIPISPSARQSILELDGPLPRLVRLIGYLREALQATSSRTDAAVPPVTSQTLVDQATADLLELEARLDTAGLPPEARRVAHREVDRLASLTTASPDYNSIRTYLQTLADLPWRPSPEPEIDLERARSTLDRDHYGVVEVKERIIEHLAVRKLRRERTSEPSARTASHARRQPVLCLVGPPGVGKTSLGRSIAEALERPFMRISLGGVTDEAEIRGHRRTYLGAMPGRIIQSLTRAGSTRPLVMLDELDKIGSGPKGDPAAALLDVLDPEQQREFVDHYVGVPFDISSIFFIATANTLETVPEALRDRLEVIRLPGYTEDEKVEIGMRHIVPRQMEWHALTPADLTWQPEGVAEIVASYTREAGVRQLDRQIATVCRRVAARIAQGRPARRPVRVTPKFVLGLLGAPRFLSDEPQLTDQPGVVTGVFWTPVGGDVMHVEALMMPGRKTLTVTGQLGDVMRESAQAALSYVRARAYDLGVDPDFFEHNDIHLHVPLGAVAKDGPSAGVTLVAALVSLLTNTAVPADIAMTGELTLRGRVLAVGGIKEKVLAAKRAGMHTVVLPTGNRRDLEEVQPDALLGLNVVFAATVDEVLEVALPGSARKQSGQRRSARRLTPPRPRLRPGSELDSAAAMPRG